MQQWFYEIQSKFDAGKPGEKKNDDNKMLISTIHTEYSNVQYSVFWFNLFNGCTVRVWIVSLYNVRKMNRT